MKMVKRDKLGRFTKECVGKDNLFYGEHHTTKVKENQRDFMKQNWKNPKYRENQIEKSKGQHYSPETEFKKGIIPWSKTQKGIHLSPQSEFKKGHKTWNIGLTKKTDERIKSGGEKGSKTRKRLFKEGKWVSPMKNKNHTKETKDKLKISGKKKWENKKYRENQIKVILKGLMQRPTSFEQKICNLCLKHNLPFIYTGDGRFLVGFKNPDFKHKHIPVLIEVYNDYHHPNNYEEIRGDHFKKYGYETIFINEGEVTHENWEKICLNKINKFNNSVNEVFK